MSDQPSPLSESTDASLESFVRRARIERDQAAPALDYPVMDPDVRVRYTLRFGVGLGFVAALFFAMVSQAVNLVMLPGLPLYGSWVELGKTVLLILIIGTLFGLISVSSMASQNRVASFIGLLILVLIFNKFYEDYGSIPAGIMEGIAFLFWFLLPILFILMTPVPFYFLIRWAVHKQVSNHYRPYYALPRLAPMLLLFVVAALAGSLFMFSSSERQAIRAMDTLMAQASAARADEELPYAVRYAWGTPFFPYAGGAYSLKAMHNPLPKRVFADGRPYLMDIPVTAEFGSGYWLTCEFGRTTGRVLTCRSDYVPPYPSNNG